MDKLSALQNKTLRIMHFKDFRSPARPLYVQSKILPLRKQIKFNNCVFAFKQQQKTLPIVFYNFCTPLRNVHSQNTKQNKLCLEKKPYRTRTYGIFSIQNQMVSDWNKVITKLTDKIDDLTTFSIKTKLQEFLLKNL